MKNKFKYLIKFSLKKKIGTKWFKIVNILLCLLIIFLVNMDYIIKFFGGNFNDTQTIYIVDNISQYNSFVGNFNLLKEKIKLDDYEFILDNNALNNRKEKDTILVLNSSDTEYISGEIISYDAVSRNTYDAITSTLNALKSEIILEESGLSSEELTNLLSPVNVKETVLNTESKTNEAKENLSGIITTLFIVPFFILIVTMVQMLGAEINDEKTSRGMEIIISSVSAKMHFLSKVISSLCYVLLEGLLLFFFILIGVLIRKLFTISVPNIEVTSIFSDTINMLNNTGVFSLLLKGSIVLIILFIASFIAYAIVSATLASMTTNIEDFQQLQTPLMIIMMIGYYISLMAVTFDGAIFIHIMSYIPLLSVMIAPTLYLLGEISFISLIISTLITVLATYLLYHYGLKIYRVGILNYSSSKLWQKMFKSLKNHN